VAHPCTGPAPRPEKLTADEREAAVVAKMRAWRDEGPSLRAIGERLNDENIPTKRGGRWHPNTVARVLSEFAREADQRASARQRAYKTEEKA
jgi:hypothetical protein